MANQKTIRSDRFSAAVLVFAAVLAVAFGGSAFASGSSEQGTTAAKAVTLSFANWADAEQATRPGIQAIISKFEAANPTITIKSEAISFSDIGHTLVLRVKSGNPPDV
ncbi:MAG TPA: hypothetical protein VMW69_15415, partial [Spirochaetia bacterium]|nr:hypothetical protein [Spirochaetia bacterium]